MDMKLNSDYLDELINYCGRNIVGKIMKRFEVIQDKEVLKPMIKETIYEEMRHLKDLIISANFGLEMSQFTFNSKDKTSKGEINGRK